MRSSLFSLLFKNSIINITILFFALQLFYFLNINLFILTGGWLLYNIVLVLPYINMNLPQVYMCPHPESPSHLSPHTIPLGYLSFNAVLGFTAKLSERYRDFPSIPCSHTSTASFILNMLHQKVHLLWLMKLHRYHKQMV